MAATVAAGWFVASRLSLGDLKQVATKLDARLLAPSAELVHGREAIAAFWSAGVQAGIWDVELEELELTRQDGLAYEIGRYALHLQPADDGPVVDRGKYLLVHARQTDGSWRRVVEMFNPETRPA